MSDEKKHLNISYMKSNDGITCMICGKSVLNSFFVNAINKKDHSSRLTQLYLCKKCTIEYIDRNY